MPTATQLTPVRPTSRQTIENFVKLDSVSLIIPAYNDQDTIGRLLRDSGDLLSKITNSYEIIVCNDGSKDATLDRIKEEALLNPNITVIDHKTNKGFGKTIRELYMAGNKEFIFSLPGDYQYAPREILKMAQGLKDHDFVIGWRIQRNDPPRRKMQSAVYNMMLRIFYGNKNKDVNSIKLFKKDVMDCIKLQSYSPFVDAELCIRAQRAGFKLIEIPIEHLPRLTQGASGGKFSVIWETFSDLVGMRSGF